MAELPNTIGVKQSSRVEGLFLIVVVLVAALLLVWRSFMWSDPWGDESYQLATAMRYVLGDRPLVDSWDTNFSSAVLAMPFVHFYLSATGSTDGILLAYRGVFVVLSAMTSLASWFALKNLLGRRLTAAVSILLLLYLPWLSPLVGYGADWLWHMLAAFMAVRLYAHPPLRMILHCIPGALSAVAVIGNPPTVSVVPFFAAALLNAHRRSGLQTAWIVTGCYLIGGAVVGAAFAVVLRTLAGPDVFSLLQHVTAPDDHDFGVSAHLRRLWDARWILALAAGIGLFVAALRRTVKDRGSSVGVPVALLLSVSFAAAAIATRRIPVLWAPQSLVFISAGSLLLAQSLSVNRRWSPEQKLLVLPALGAGVGWYFGSNGGIVSAVVTAPLLLVAAMLPWGGALGAHPADSRVSRALRLSGLLLLGCLIAAVGVIGMRHTPEGLTSSMTSRLEDGPHKGIYATPQQAEYYGKVLRAVRGLPPLQGRVVFMERFPLGYLVQPALPGTYSTWATSASTARLRDYVDLTGNMPARIVLTRFRLHSQDGEFPSSVNLTGFPDRYTKVYEDDNVRVFDRLRP